MLVQDGARPQDMYAAVGCYASRSIIALMKANNGFICACRAQARQACSSAGSPSVVLGEFLAWRVLAGKVSVLTAALRLDCWARVVWRLDWVSIASPKMTQTFSGSQSEAQVQEGEDDQVDPDPL